MPCGELGDGNLKLLVAPQQQSHHLMTFHLYPCRYCDAALPYRWCLESMLSSSWAHQTVCVESKGDVCARLDYHYLGFITFQKRLVWWNFKHLFAINSVEMVQLPFSKANIHCGTAHKNGTKVVLLNVNERIYKDEMGTLIRSFKHSTLHNITITHTSQ